MNVRKLFEAGSCPVPVEEPAVKPGVKPGAPKTAPGKKPNPFRRRDLKPGVFPKPKACGMDMEESARRVNRLVARLLD